MRRCCGGYALVVALIPAVLGAADSDHRYRQSFEEKTAALSTTILQAKSSVDLDAVTATIASVEKEFEPRKSFLDQARFPNTFDGAFQELRSEVSALREKLAMIEQLNASIAAQTGTIQELEGKGKKQSASIESLEWERSRLTAEMDKMKKEFARRLAAARAFSEKRAPPAPKTAKAAPAPKAAATSTGAPAK